MIDFADLEEAVKMVRAKGFGGPWQMPILANPQESAAIQTWRNGSRQRSSRDHRIDLHPADRSPDPGLTHGYR